MLCKQKAVGSSPTVSTTRELIRGGPPLSCGRSYARESALGPHSFDPLPNRKWLTNQSNTTNER